MENLSTLHFIESQTHAKVDYAMQALLPLKFSHEKTTLLCQLVNVI